MPTDPTPAADEPSPDSETLEDRATGLPGPAFWRMVMTAESARSSRYGRPATVLLAEIVGLQDLGALWGDDVAGRAISSVARVLRSSCRASDYVVRLGPARFGVLLTETDEVAAVNLVERVRERCERQLGAAEGAFVAFGWAGASSTLTLLAAADLADGRLRQERDSR